MMIRSKENSLKGICCKEEQRNGVSSWWRKWSKEILVLREKREAVGMTEQRRKCDNEVDRAENC